MKTNEEAPFVGPVRERSFDKGALIDLVLVMATLVIVKQSMLAVTTLYAGPISTFSAMAVATWLLKRRGWSWRDLGLRKPESWLKAIGLTLFSFLFVAVAMQCAQWLAGQLFEDIGTSGRFDHIEGNTFAYLGIMALVWTHGSFFEEMLFRAFIISKASRLLGGGAKADWAAAIFSSIFFGYRHYYYKGMHGALVTGAAGFAFASLYLWFGRKNLLPQIMAHGIMNSLAQTTRYLGLRE